LFTAALLSCAGRTIFAASSDDGEAQALSADADYAIELAAAKARDFKSALPRTRRLSSAFPRWPISTMSWPCP
jgi:hypothetical protein